MAVKLRLMRMGKKKQPTYRVVAADARSPRNGRFIEIVGTYDPRQEPSSITIDNDRAVEWLRNGAQPTESVRKLLEISGAWQQFGGAPTVRPAPAPKVETPSAPATETLPAAEPAAAATPSEAPEAEAEAAPASEPEPPAPAPAEAETTAVESTDVEGDTES